MTSDTSHNTTFNTQSILFCLSNKMHPTRAMTAQRSTVILLFRKTFFQEIHE